ncbi:glutaminyl-peptide cyclotransferase [Nocardia sp. NPDC005998]|uniref:glutaminyl-peptide cyclotransferase n=1 Tax=Nocardia sp. NPDC005998 TaxID=3156894 RepID=UPI00339FD356
MERNRRSLAVIVLISLLGLTGCRGSGDDPPRLRIEVVDTRPHDPRAFTEGLEVDGTVLYESTGMPGASRVRATDLTTGDELTGVELPAPYFGEGVSKAGDILWQLTWQDRVAIARDPVTLAERSRVSYEGEGWGLCTRAGRLVMSNGSDTLTFRDPLTFAPTGTVTLTTHNNVHLNELDCAADGSIYANSYPTDEILRIDPETGAVLAVIDASGLLPATVRAGTDVLNGIAQLPGTDHFLITGKYWPTIFEVRFVPE